LSGLDCEAGNCLPGSDSVWFLVVLIVVWAAVVGLAVMWGVVCWRERQEERTGHRPAHRPERGPQLRLAMSVEEIQHRLATEAARPTPPVRKHHDRPSGDSPRTATSGEAGGCRSGHGIVRLVRRVQ